MDKLLEKLFDINKVPTKIVVVICLCCAIILFVPAGFLTKLNLTGFLTDYGKYIGITFIISSCLSLLALISYVSQIRTRKVNGRRFKKGALQGLQHLNMHEQALLREFLIQGKSAIQIPIHNEIMIGLVNKGIIHRVSNVGQVGLSGPAFSYSIRDFVSERLTYEILSLPQNPTEREKGHVIAARPTWAREQERMERLWRDSTWF